MAILRCTFEMRKRDSKRQAERYGRGSNEQCIASKSPFSRFLMVDLLRRLDECSRSSDKERPSNVSEATVREWLDIWYGLLAEPSIPRFNEPDDMAGVLADLRRFPDRLANAFAPLPCGDELLARVKLCIDAAQHHDGIGPGAVNP